MSVEEKWYTIPEAADFLGFSQAYIRTLIRKNQLTTDMVPLSEGSLVMRHVITESSMGEFLNTVPHKTRRNDGRNKFIVYISPDEYPRVLDVLEENGLGEVARLLEPANKVKSY